MISVTNNNAGQKKYVPVISGAAEILVTHRELRNTYQTNRSIKSWATYFLLKSLTSSGVIQDWTAQKQGLLSYCKMTENAFRARLRELQQLNLIEVHPDRSIAMISYRGAAEILGIDYQGTTKIEYDETCIDGKQVFQYLLRAEELRSNQARQLDALWYHVNRNQLVKDTIVDMMIKQIGSDKKRLDKDPGYFQQQLLLLQMRSFAKGSSLLQIVFAYRADINRSAAGIKDDHRYKSAQSVSYMKRVMRDMALITVQKICVESEARSRLYVPASGGNARRDGYKYIRNSQKTAWFLCDQVSFLFDTIPPPPLKAHNEDRKPASLQAAA